MENKEKNQSLEQLNQADFITLCIYGLSFLSALLFLSLPLVNLLNPSPWQRSIGTIHSLGALSTTVIAAYTGHLAFPLARRVRTILPQIRTLSFWSAILSFLGIATGNLAYMRYRADLATGGARAWLIENTPLVQYIVMEFHEFSVLFILPINTACAWVLWNYGDDILEKRNRSVLLITCLALILSMFFSIGGLVSGLAVAKIKAL
jgi:hypothetical protein